MNITAEHLTLRYGEKLVLEDFTASFQPGLTCLMGPSGCGKTTLLHVLAGLLKPQAGKVQGTGRAAFVFQEDRLLPWYSARDNVAAALPGPREPALLSAEEWLRRVGLAGEENTLPSELSGGMRQRVSLARALACDGDALFLDEPFRALDAVTRKGCMELVKAFAAERPVLLVTHNEEEALELGGRVLRVQGPPLRMAGEELPN